MAFKKTITVFEHQIVRLNEVIDNVIFDEPLLQSLQEYHGVQGVPFYSLGNKSVKFCEYVGVIKIGNTTIEVLPKADRENDKTRWRNMLIDMVKSVGLFKIHAPTSSTLKIKPNSILELYFELFIQQVEHLLNLGLIKKYRKFDSNCSSLKGNMLFAKHIQLNLVHKERFYTRHTSYDYLHTIHRIIYKTLMLLKSINSNQLLQSRIDRTILNFPEQWDVTVTESSFAQIAYNRKSEPYRDAIEIARLLLLNFHPNLNQGNDYLLALMFDMNLLWERFVFVSIKRHIINDHLDYEVTAQRSKFFWKPKQGNRSAIKPDIVIASEKHDETIVIDTKWKNLNGYNPSPDDLRQLYVYHEYYNAKKVALVYPGNFEIVQGTYYKSNQDLSNKECSLIGIEPIPSISHWKDSIGEKISSWMLV
jgi:5-methylcytosine-specific restriction enzyme subunit McrC